MFLISSTTKNQQWSKVAFSMQQYDIGKKIFSSPNRYFPVSITIFQFFCAINLAGTFGPWKLSVRKMELSHGEHQNFYNTFPS